TRVDHAACQRLGVQSIAVAPVIGTDVVLGIVEIFAADAEAFSTSDVAELEKIAATVGRALADADADGTAHPVSRVAEAQPITPRVTPREASREAFVPETHGGGKWESRPVVAAKSIAA